MAVTRTSELQAINTMLSAIGEAPINTLRPTTETADVTIAKNLLNEVSRETQSVGWHFNRETDVELTQTVDDEILIPETIAYVDVESINSGITQYVQRGNRLYNKTDHTHTITSSLKCTVIYMLDWDDLPQVARHYIMIKAARRLQDRVVGSGSQHDFNQIDEYQALIALKANEAQEGDFSIFDNNDVYRIINRSNVIDRVIT
jgi:hypothetical protein